MLLKYYLDKLGNLSKPEFLEKYLKCPSLLRLNGVGYFCGMDYASKDIYTFSEYISRYDHSLTVALLTYKLTKDKLSTLAALFHDVATPCFSHVIDYMNKDYAKQESTEEYTERILRSDKYLIKCLNEDDILLEDIIDFKKYPIVDNDRPRVCADRLDGVILTGIAWTKNITASDIDDIVDDMIIYKNEDKIDEIGFKSISVAKKVLEVSKTIDIECHSSYDNYMMELLAKITRSAISKNVITYDDLYTYEESKLLDLFKKSNKELMDKFENIKMKDIPDTIIPNIKIRDLNPLVNGKRIKVSC